MCRIEFDGSNVAIYEIGVLDNERFKAFWSSRSRMYITKSYFYVESSNILPLILLVYKPRRRAFIIKNASTSFIFAPWL